MGSCLKHAAEATMVASLHYHKITFAISEYVNLQVAAVVFRHLK